jgi:hypothetical protein
MGDGAPLKLGTGEILDQTWRMFRAHFWTFVYLMGLPTVAMVLCTLIMFLIVPIRPGVPLRDVWTGMNFTPKLGIFLLFLALVGVINRVLAASILAVREFHDGREIGALRALRNVRHKHLRLFWLLFLAGLFSVGPLAIISLPAAIFLPPALPVATLENLSVTRALRRSNALAKGGYGRIILLLLLYVVLVVAVVFGLGGVLVSAEQALSHAWFWRPVYAVAFWIFLLIPQWYMIALTVNYFDQRRQRDELASDLRTGI